MRHEKLQKRAGKPAWEAARSNAGGAVKQICGQFIKFLRRSVTITLSKKAL
jgi:hypothetical protein